MALYTTATDEAGGGTEVTAVATGYVRQVATFGIPDGVTVSTADILFPVATASYGTVTDFALLDDVTGGNMLYYGELPVHKTIAIDDQVKFTAGSLQVSVAGLFWILVAQPGRYACAGWGFWTITQPVQPSRTDLSVRLPRPRQWRRQWWRAR